MLNKIIHFSIYNKLIIGILVLGLIAFGSYELTRLPIDAVPDITDNQVQVITVSPSLGAPDVERLITFPIEIANSNIAGIKEIRSFSRFGLSVVTIVFEDHVNVYWARQQVGERLLQIQKDIPAGLGSPELAPVTTGLGEIYQYVVKPKPGYESKYTPLELRTIQDWMVRRQLLGTPGVADVSSFGGYLKQYEIAINPDKLKSFGLTIGDVFDALARNNQNTGGTYIEKGPTVLFIRSEGLVGNIADINNIVVKNIAHGSPLLIRDVADVRIGHATRYGAMNYNDKGEVAGAVVMMLKGANSSEVIKNVKSRISQIRKILPEGVEIEPFLDRTKMVNNAIGTVEKNLMEGALIVIFILVLFLGNLRAGLIVASVIPLSMLFAIIMMNLFGVSGNLMSLGAIDFGLIVDGAVIIVEAVMHRLTHAKSLASVNRIAQDDMNKEVELAASRMMNAAIFGQIIILIVYLPILTLQGIEGKMFKPMAQTVAFALAGAFLLSLTYVPMMSALMISKKISHKPTWADKMMAVLENRYKKDVLFFLQFPKTIIAAAVVVFLIALGVLTTLGGEFIPKLEEGDFAVESRVMTGSNLGVTLENTCKAASILKARFPEVEKVVTKIGSGEIPTDPMPIEAADMMVILKDKHSWTSAKTFDELAEKMSHELEDVPGLTVGFQYPVQMRFNELMTGARQDVVCKIYGESLDSLAVYAQHLGEMVKTVDGAKDIYVETVTGIPQIIIRYKRDAIAKYGMNIEDINRTVNAAFAGQQAGLVYEGEKRFGLVVRLAGELRRDIQDVQNLLVHNPQGNQVPLYLVADVELKEGPHQIQREDAKRRIVVGFNVRGRDVQSIVEELQHKVDQSLRFASGYFVTYGGTFENLQAARQRLGIAVPVALALILLMLYLAFNSFKHGLLIFSAIPLSAIGGIFALALRGMPFSISAGVGFIALFGVAVLNGIVLIAEFTRLRASGISNVITIVEEGTKSRLRPVLMTASVASLGFLPMALSEGAGAEVQRPLATVVIGGLITATVLTLFVLPVLYTVFDRFRGRRKMAEMLVFTGVCLSLSATLAAQSRPVDLAEALRLAETNSLQLKADALQPGVYRTLGKIRYELPATNFMIEYGQINSAYNDNRIAVSQEFLLPRTFEAQRQLHLQQARTSESRNLLNASELRHEVRKTYYELLLTEERRKWLLYADSIYREAEIRAATRLQGGETDKLESLSANLQRQQVQQQIRQVNAEQAVLQQTFRYLLQADCMPVPGNMKADLTVSPDSAGLRSNPQLLLGEQLVNEARQQWEVEKTRLLPALTLGLNNLSIVGWQNTDGTDRYYGSGSRFTSINAGILVPLYRKPFAARTEAAQLQWEQVAAQLAATSRQVRTAWENAWLHYNNLQQTVAYYENTALPLSREIQQTATSQYANGAINFLEWALLSAKSLDTRSAYLETIRQLNAAVFEIEHLAASR